MVEIIYKDESYQIIGACFNVHSQLGPGFLEAVYQEALEMEFEKQNIPFERQKKLTIIYEGKALRKYYVADFVCYGKIILEIKAVNGFYRDQFNQTGNYLRAINYKLGLLVNFGTSSLTHKRILNSSYSQKFE
ncbi:GxxExxY protein [Plebeiibacterium sediminum]|uniref:GxxExxY protein n=1 Tax=Plebeiibacterium sediminum TaxID=2992112 RepID=A0AAE3SF75_9BACT|nr:GxxExxY protein [Plebeiobacterium sediminum]MCW3786752.1 GxxExxY protein [Plebeiobacterium sediminum]